MENEKIKNFTDLVAWKEAHRLSLRIYQVTRTFPKDEQFGLVSQMRRAAVSVSSNIAEGFGRRTNADKKHFYSMAGGSIAELQSQLILARDLGYFAAGTHTDLFAQTESVYRLLNGLIGHLA